MTTRQRDKRITEILQGIAIVSKAASRAESEQNRDNLTIYTKAYSALLGEAIGLDPKSKYIRILV